MNLVMTGSNRFIEVQASAERQVFDETQLQSMMRLARKGLESLLIKQQAVLGEVSPVHGK
jgi:ribonuclease PH